MLYADPDEGNRRWSHNKVVVLLEFFTSSVPEIPNYLLI